MRQLGDAVAHFLAGKPLGDAAKELGQRFGPHRVATKPVEVLGSAAGKVDPAAAQRHFLVRRREQRHRGDGAVRQDPAVLAPLAVEQRELERAQGIAHPGQAARHHGVTVFLRDGERAQRDVRRSELVAGEHGSDAAGEPLLGDERAGV
jgi:hypothetical protein